MTACVNRKHTKKVAAVVTASLVGALSLGAAPVAAVADTGIETLALTADEAFAKGSLTKATDDQGRRISIPSDGLLTVEQGKGLKPTQITPAGGADPVEIKWEDDTCTNADVKFYSGFNTTSGDQADLSVAGNYTMVVKMTDGDYFGAQFKMNFVVAKAANLADAVLFDNDDDDNDTTDTTFTYNGKPQKIGVAIDGKVLKENTDYKIRESVTNAGTHSVTIEGLGNYENQTRVMNVTVGKLDLSKADITVADVEKGATVSVSKITADGDEFTVGSGEGYVQAQLTYSPNETGKASARITSTDNTNFAGSATVEFSVVDEVVEDFQYADANFSGDLKIDLSEGESFKASRIVVKDDGGTTLPTSYYTVSYEDADGNSVDASALQNPGTYYVKIRVNASACNYAYGSATVSKKVVVKSGTIADEDVVFNYDGKVGSDFDKVYDGKDFLDQLEITVGDLVEGTDYTVKVTKGDDEVDSIVNVGSYEIVLEGSGVDELDESERKCTVDVTALDLTGVAIAVNGGDLNAYTYDVPTASTDEDGNPITVPVPTTVWYLGYTGEELTPSFELGYYTDEDGDPVKEIKPSEIDDYTWNAFPADAVTVTGYVYQEKNGAEKEDVDVIKDKGIYTVELVLESDNFKDVDGATENVITVSDSRIAFADVDPNAWYAGAVFDAKQLGYIKGIQDSNLYAPESSISRADALVIISRMAGADSGLTEDWLNENSGYVTRYTDVEPGAYYAKAVAWATKVGVVHGYDDGSFQPNKEITREEFATMLANYAKAMGKFTASDGTALDAMPDAGTVSDWAEESVAWAVANKVMGNGGFIGAQTDISRAEVAAMAVNYQPDGINQGVIG